MYNFDKARKRIGTYSMKWDQYHDPDILALSTADMDFDSPVEVRDALVKRAQEGFYGYEDKSATYYQAIIDWYQRRHGWTIKKEWISNVPGVWTAMHMCVEAFTKAGDAVLVHSPHFSPIVNILRGCGRRMVTNAMVFDGEKYTIDFDSMEKVIAQEKPSAFIMINPQNPTGRVFTEEELINIGKLCAKYDVKIISDEVHANVVYDGHKHYPAAMVSDEMQALSAVITAPSKSFNLQGLTYAIVVIPNEKLLEKFEFQRSAYNMEFAVNVFSIAALEAAYSKCDGWLAALNDYLAANLSFTMDYIKNSIPKVKAIKPEGSYMVWLDFRALNKTPSELRELLLKNHIGLTYGDSFGPEGNGFERINIACPRATLEACLERIKNMVDSVQ